MPPKTARPQRSRGPARAMPSPGTDPPARRGGSEGTGTLTGTGSCSPWPVIRVFSPQKNALLLLHGAPAGGSVGRKGVPSQHTETLGLGSPRNTGARGPCASPAKAPAGRAAPPPGPSAPDHRVLRATDTEPGGGRAGRAGRGPRCGRAGSSRRGFRDLGHGSPKSVRPAAPPAGATSPTARDLAPRKLSRLPTLPPRRAAGPGGSPSQNFPRSPPGGSALPAAGNGAEGAPRPGSGGRGRPWRPEVGKVAPRQAPGPPERDPPRARPETPSCSHRLGGDPARRSPKPPDPRLTRRARRAAGLGGRQPAPALPGPRLPGRSRTLDPRPRTRASASPTPGRQPGRPHLRHSPPPSPPPPPSSILRPLPQPASPEPAREGPRAGGAAGAERAGGRAAPAARGPGRGRTPPAGRGARAGRRRHVTRWPRPRGCGGRGLRGAATPCPLGPGAGRR